MAQFDSIYRDIQDGFTSLSTCHQRNRERLNDARMNLDFYRGDFDPYKTVVARENPDLLNIPWRNVLLMRQIVDRLTDHLYRQDPTRTIPDNPTATDWLQKVYADNRMHGKWLTADKLTVISQAAAFQIAGTSDPMHPIKIHLWDASQFVVYASPDDPTEPQTVVTIDDYDDGSGVRKRYQVWTADTYRVLISEVTGSVEKRLITVEETENPYGVLPFAFAFYATPVLGFWTGSPGNVIRDANAYVNYRLTDLALDIGQLKPVGIAENVGPEWSPKGKYRVGQWLMLPTENDASGNPIGDPRLSYVEPGLAYVDGTWSDVENFVRTTLEAAGVPEAAVRMSQGSARSGVSVISEQAPLIQFALSRQSLFYEFESDLAKKVVQVGVAHLRRNGVLNAALEQSLKDWRFNLRWGKAYPPVLPGPEQDLNDTWLLSNGLKSKVMVLQERYGYTREEAILHLNQVVADAEEFEEIVPEEDINALAPENPQEEAKEDVKEEDGEEETVESEADAD